jgi:hypothetical protein
MLCLHLLKLLIIYLQRFPCQVSKDFFLFLVYDQIWLRRITSIIFACSRDIFLFFCDVWMSSNWRITKRTVYSSFFFFNFFLQKSESDSVALLEARYYLCLMKDTCSENLFIYMYILFSPFFFHTLYEWILIRLAYVLSFFVLTFYIRGKSKKRPINVKKTYFVCVVIFLPDWRKTGLFNALHKGYHWKNACDIFVQLKKKVDVSNQGFPQF